MLLSETETLRQVLEAVVPTDPERIAAWEAGGRVLAEEVAGTIALPRFDNSTMDGYAVRAAEAGAGARLRLIGEQPAGPDLGLTLSDRGAIRIYTGAPIPGGADAVVMQEDCQAAGDDIVVREPVERGENIRIRGGDLAEGQRIALAGTRLTSALLAVLASQGRETVCVFRRPKVAVLATGSELRTPNQLLGEGEIFDTNRIMLADLVGRVGGIPLVFDVISDEEQAHLAAFERAAGSDAIVVAGGVSVGAKDLVKPTLRKLGCEMKLWRVAVKPGKPFLFGHLGKALVFGLPGNPVSAFITFLLFVRPAILRMGGVSDISLPAARVRTGVELANAGDRPHYLRGQITDGAFRPVGRQESHALFALSQANGLVRVDAHQTIASGVEVEAILLS
ncbi:MAG: gephyrin-like molybdotransferase Glp [Chthoniobacterales bacterium]